MTRTYAITHAAATDAGSRSMRTGSRSRWSRADYNAAVREFERIEGAEADKPQQERESDEREKTVQVQER